MLAFLGMRVRPWKVLVIELHCVDGVRFPCSAVLVGRIALWGGVHEVMLDAAIGARLRVGKDNHGYNDNGVENLPGVILFFLTVS